MRKVINDLVRMEKEIEKLIQPQTLTDPDKPTHERHGRESVNGETMRTLGNGDELTVTDKDGNVHQAADDKEFFDILMKKMFERVAEKERLREANDEVTK